MHHAFTCLDHEVFPSVGVAFGLGHLQPGASSAEEKTRRRLLESARPGTGTERPTTVFHFCVLYNVAKSWRCPLALSIVMSMEFDRLLPRYGYAVVMFFLRFHFPVGM